MQKELEEIAAQEAVYKKAIDEENRLDDEQQPLLPTTLHDPVDAFLNYHEEAGLTSTPEAPILTSSTPVTPAINNVSVTSSSPSIHVLHPQPEPPTSHNAPPQAPLVPPVQEPRRTLCPFSPVYTTTSFSIGGQRPPIIPAISTAQSEYHPSTPRDFCGNPPAFFLPPVTPFLPVSQSYTAQLTDTLAKITQLQRLPQATPDVLEGNDSDNTKFFLWENAFESLVDSAPVTARQKLHLLYQYLGGKAKKVVEQLQY